MKIEKRYLGEIDFSTAIVNDVEYVYEENNKQDTDKHPTCLLELGVCRVCEYSMEYSQPPHIHIECNTGNSDICIRIDVPQYILGGKFKNTLSESQKEILHKWMNSPSEIDNRFTNWQVCKTCWKVLNKENCYIDKMPNYRRLSKSKDDISYDIIDAHDEYRNTTPITIWVDPVKHPPESSYYDTYVWVRSSNKAIANIDKAIKNGIKLYCVNMAGDSGSYYERNGGGNYEKIVEHLAKNNINTQLKIHSNTIRAKIMDVIAENKNALNYIKGE